MIEITELEVFNIKGAIRGMRNPLNSWALSDSKVVNGEVIVGDKDMDLMKRLYKAGTDHRKYLRQIFVCMDINAPLYWWKQADTYKVGTTSNSCSTMHKIHAKKFVKNDFANIEQCAGDPLFTTIIIKRDENLKLLNSIREKYLEEKDPIKKKLLWRTMIEDLPSSYKQKRTVTCTFENLVNMIKSRRNHKLKEWHIFCDVILEQIPLLKEIMEG